ncbi:MAG: Tad domain-containing protein [Sphingomonas sp.]|uniref:TadE/TadG family type IV pilus assembly protein n=1 Tax=Sphingomonas sp. TaxID=28214 RepID=UPI00227359D9|nr:TadE/TadG family type IV pilus assembly protein [Sphingomonas sp.]MCX8476896.1 Tad domain-containing protein [Sphingomonas sp.]
MVSNRQGWTEARAFLTRLARDTRGNTLALMAIALIPLAGMVGGGVDISRMYIVKTRLQHACDAGALAGRKMMGGGSWSANTYAARGEAERFFDANYNPNAYGTTLEQPAQRRSFTESAGKVTGNARAIVPMTIMRIFGKTSTTLTVTCDAEMRLPNTDVMFVLDTTGSMRWCPNGDSSCNGNSSSRIAALRKSVKCFYQIVARLDVPDVDCDGDEPTGGTGNQVQIRFGFVPYSTNVNVGRLLPNDYLVDEWEYQTRKANLAVPPQSTTTYWETYGGGSISQGNCLSFMKNEAFGTFTPTPLNSGGPNPTPTVVSSFPHDGVASDSNNGEWGWSGASDRNGNDKSCRRRRTDTTTYYVEKFASWTYNQLPVTVSGLKAGGSTWNNSFTWPVGDTAIGNDVTNSTITWSGCIEERETEPTTDYDPIPSTALDLDIDMVPNSDESRWKPALPRLIFTRSSTDGSEYNANSWGGSWYGTWGWNVAPETTSNDYRNGSTFFCPTEARKLQAWTDASIFQGYVNSLNPDGNTYHDIGIIWGARLMSPTGIFKAENATAPNGGEIERHMIFMTDGDTNANDYDYAAYGLPFFDHRQTPANPTKAQLDEQVNLRFLAICNWVKNKNITLWVINFGEGQSQDTKDRLEACAAEGRYFSAADSTALQQTFKSIADQISQLRLTK